MDDIEREAIPSRGPIHAAEIAGVILTRILMETKTGQGFWP
jgi:hypothetical protein